MTDIEKKFHETWLGMVQPIEGLVVSVPVLIEAQCMQRLAPEAQTKLVSLCPPTRETSSGAEGHAIRDLGAFFAELLGLTPDLFDAGSSVPEELSLYVAEGRQMLRPTLGLRKMEAEPPPADGDEAADTTPASRAGAKYAALVWDTTAVVAEAAASGHSPAGAPAVLDLDKPETVTGPWDYPPAAKFDRLLRHCRVPVGILTNREIVRLVYAPHGESSGHITFRIEDMVTVDGRPILDAFVMLLSATRFFGVAKEHALPALLAESRKRQANVTNELAEQVFQALGILLAGFEAAAERDGRTSLDDALAREGDHIYKGLLTVLLRLVFVLYAEDRGLLPTDHSFYADHLSVLELFERLQEDAGAHPDSMPRRFGSWGQLVGLFRAVYLGVEHGDLRMPPRRGALFDPNTYPFLEGWGPAGGAPIVMPEHRAEVRVPTVDDCTVHQLLEKLVIFEGQRLSYRTLDVEQIGSVYEALMGYHVTRVPAPAVCMKPDGIWLTTREVLDVPAARRAKWLKEEIGLSKAQADALAEKLAGAKDEHAALDELAEYAKGSRKADKALARAKAGQLVLQPGAERRRTSSHYTPRSLSAPIVRRTLEPLLACMGPEPPSERILHLKICDPAMGSGAFLVEACRFLGDHLVAAWTREGKLEEVAGAHEDPVLHARRMVAQRCLYGVDKNDAAVELAKLSLWLVTLAKDLPFTFLDHALRHGDSLVGLSFDQIKAFHWKPDKQVQLAEQVLKDALDEAISIRQQILELANDGSPEAQREKERLLDDAEDASDRARLLGDVVVGAFFAHDKDKDREKERQRRLTIVQRWLAGDAEAETELRQMQAEIRGRLPVFHWMLEFPEVFYAERPDPLDEARVNRAAYMDGFVGNPPFMAKAATIEAGGHEYIHWLLVTHPESHGAADIVAHFFRRCGHLVGRHGTVGLIATNTVAEGDTRDTGLAPLVRSEFRIYDAITSLIWPGEAAVSVALVHLAIGKASEHAGAPRLDGRSVGSISSRLSAQAERVDPAPLFVMKPLRFLGSKAYGTGFVIDDEERTRLLHHSSSNGDVVLPYVGGEEVNSSPTQSPNRHAIYFGQLSLEQAAGYVEPLEIVKERVLPERLLAKDSTADGAHRKRYWWQFAQPRPELLGAVRPLKRCLVNSQVSKHLIFAWQPTNRIFAHTLYVYALETSTAFAVLQSGVHEPWARLLSSSLEDRLRYVASDCFDTFPFPQPDPRTAIPALEDIGQRLYDARAKYMIETQQGLTQTYNKLKDATCHDAPIIEVRRLHEEMDRAVLDAYTWTDIKVPPYCPATPAEHKALEHFQNEVIDRLFVLNAERAEEERRQGLGDGKKGKQKCRAKKAGKRATSENQGKLELE